MKKTVAFAFILISFQSLLAQFGGKPQYEILTTQLGDTLGVITVELFPTIAPKHVANFDSIVHAPISFDNRAFHRCVPGFVIQGGDPNSISGPESTWGQGDPSQANVEAEFNPVSHQRGILSAARATDPNSASSQFFICVDAATWLDNNYTVYGNTIGGIDIVDTIVGKPQNSSNLPNDKIEMFIHFIGVDSTVPAYAPSLTGPADGVTDVFGSTQFSWTKADSTDFLTYKIQFSQLSDFSAVDLEFEIDTSLSSNYLSGLEQGFKTYYWRACSNNGGNITCSAARSLTTFVAYPTLLFPTVALYPATTEPTFTWNPVAGADAYHLQVSKNENFNIVIQRVLDTVVTDTTFLIDQLETTTKYYWRVASVVNGTDGDFSPFRAFITTPNADIQQADPVNPIRVYPNPTYDQVRLDFGQKLNGNYKVRIYNETGSEVFSTKLHTNRSSVLDIDLSEWSSGMYYYTVSNSNRAYAGRIIKSDR